MFFSASFYLKGGRIILKPTNKPKAHARQISNEEEKEDGSTKCHGGTVFNSGWLSHPGSIPGTAIVWPWLSLQSHLPPTCLWASHSASAAVIGCRVPAPSQSQPHAHDIPFTLISCRALFQCSSLLEHSICIKTCCNFYFKKSLPRQRFLSSYHCVLLLPFIEKLRGLSSLHCLQFLSSLSFLNPLPPGLYPITPPKSVLSRSPGLPCS